MQLRYWKRLAAGNGEMGHFGNQPQGSLLPVDQKRAGGAQGELLDYHRFVQAIQDVLRTA